MRHAPGLRARSHERGRGVDLGALPLPQVLMVLGLVLCVVPLASDQYTRWQARQLIGEATVAAASEGDDSLAVILAQAQAYNALLGGYDATDDAAGISEEDVLPYEEQLVVEGTRAMAWLEVPRANILLPLFHGDGEEALAQGVGHLEASSLPVGGQRAHCWLEGHSGMATSALFDGIRVLEAGDVLALHVLNETYAYRVTSWEIVDPDDVTTVDIREADEVTLVTCTTTPDAWNPKGRYGVNDKRLLVHATRCAYDPAEFESAGQEAATDPALLVNEHNWQLLFAAAVTLALGLAAGVRALVVARRRVR